MWLEESGTCVLLDRRGARGTAPQKLKCAGQWPAKFAASGSTGKDCRFGDKIACEVCRRQAWRAAEYRGVRAYGYEDALRHIN
jgi:hypothetical protein